VSRIACLLTVFTASLTAAPNLELYFVDVEGGKSVLMVSPSGQSMLFDAGWPAFNNRPASTDPIVEAVQAAGVKRIDFLVISHFDVDHMGDVPRLAAKIPVGRVFDHGDYHASNPQAMQRFAAYAELREKIGHTVLKVGDKVPIKGVDVQVLSAGGQSIAKPLPGADHAVSTLNKYLPERCASRTRSYSAPGVSAAIPAFFSVAAQVSGVLRAAASSSRFTDSSTLSAKPKRRYAHKLDRDESH
jgi:hypothetical protein